MTDLRIRITESDGIAFAGLSDNRYPQAIYRGAKARNALDRIIDGLQDYGHAEPAEMVDALHFCPEFCQLAAAVHGLHLAESDETPTTEAIAILTKLRDSRQPEAIRTRAGNLLIDIAEDDRAVCDASSVDDRPGQDAGAALVGVECYVWDGEWEEEFEAVPLKILSITENRYSARWPGYPQDQSWMHARPVYLGLPEATP